MAVKNSILNESFTSSTDLFLGLGWLHYVRLLRAAVWRASLVHAVKDQLKPMLDFTAALVHGNQEGHLYSESEVIYICNIIAILLKEL